ncbi:MAG: substrate-binding periplasmic protein [Kordiimonas sp.]
MAYPGWSRTSITVNEEQKYRLDNELLEGIMATAGCNFTHVTLPFRRILEGVKHGVFDGTVSVSKSPERSEFGWFSIPYRPEIIGIFMRADEIDRVKLNTMADLLTTTGKINIGLGTWHGSIFESFIRTNLNFQKRLIYIDDAPMMHRSLYRGRVNMVIGDIHYSSHILRTLGLLGKIKPHPFHISEEDVYLIFSKKTVSQKQLAIINNAITQFRATIQYRSILQKYSGLD